MRVLRRNIDTTVVFDAVQRLAPCATGGGDGSAKRALQAPGGRRGPPGSPTARRGFGLGTFRFKPVAAREREAHTTRASFAGHDAKRRIGSARAVQCSRRRREHVGCAGTRQRRMGWC